MSTHQISGPPRSPPPKRSCQLSPCCLLGSQGRDVLLRREELIRHQTQVIAGGSGRQVAVNHKPSVSSDLKRMRLAERASSKRSSWRGGCRRCRSPARGYRFRVPRRSPGPAAPGGLIRGVTPGCASQKRGGRSPRWPARSSWSDTVQSNKGVGEAQVNRAREARVRQESQSPATDTRSFRIRHELRFGRGDRREKPASRTRHLVRAAQQPQVRQSGLGVGRLNRSNSSSCVPGRVRTTARRYSHAAVSSGAAVSATVGSVAQADGTRGWGGRSAGGSTTGARRSDSRSERRRHSAGPRTRHCPAAGGTSPPPRRGTRDGPDASAIRTASIVRGGLSWLSMRRTISRVGTDRSTWIVWFDTAPTASKSIR